MKILIVSLSPLHRDPRVLRQIHHLSLSHEVTCAGYSDPSLQNVKYIPIERHEFSYFKKTVLVFLLFCRLYSRFMKYYYRPLNKVLESLKEIDFDLVVANDIDTLPGIVQNEWLKRPKLLFDAHEYAPREQDDELYWRVLFKPYREYLCRLFLQYSDKMVTVSNGIATEYRKEFHIAPVVITNASDYIDISPSPVTQNTIRLLHHGQAYPSRQIEKMIRVMDYTDPRFTLDLMLIVPVGCENYYQSLQKMVEPMKNVKMVPPVPLDAIIHVSNRYDIGLYLLEPTNFNNLYSLPNKIFEFIQARLAVAVGPSPEMKSLVERYGLGVVSRDFSPESMAETLNALTAGDLMHYKQRVHHNAYTLSSAVNMEILDNVIADVMEKRSASEN